MIVKNRVNAYFRNFNKFEIQIEREREREERERERFSYLDVCVSYDSEKSRQCTFSKFQQI